ncbi:MAG: hypothetical protein IMZ65_02710 [Planctomycetes bacterium]|nr:hypothetical protein [Planctomycetota bacterium]
MPSRRHITFAVLGTLVVACYIGGFCIQMTVGHLNMMSGDPAAPTRGYYFAEDAGINRACYVLYWPLAKVYEAVRPRTVFLPVSPFAPDTEGPQGDIKQQPE